MACPVNTVLAAAAANGYLSPDPGMMQAIIAQLTCDLKAAIQAGGGGPPTITTLKDHFPNVSGVVTNDLAFPVEVVWNIDWNNVDYADSIDATIVKTVSAVVTAVDEFTLFQCAALTGSCSSSGNASVKTWLAPGEQCSISSSNCAFVYNIAYVFG